MTASMELNSGELIAARTQARIRAAVAIPHALPGNILYLNRAIFMTWLFCTAIRSFIRSLSDNQQSLTPSKPSTRLTRLIQLTRLPESTLNPPL